MRVVGGIKKGKTLASFKYPSIKPTKDSVREAIFNVLGQDLSGKKVLDLFAGTGAMGIEALSRGASLCAFVDNNQGAVEVIKKNIGLCGFDNTAKVFKKDVKDSIRYLKKEGAMFNVIFIDAPYADISLAYDTLKDISGSGLLGPGGTIVCEASKRFPLKEAMGGLAIEKEKRYGDTLVYFLKAAAETFL